MNEQPKNDGQIIDLSLTAPVFPIVQRTTTFCMCEQVSLDADRRLVKCRTCGKCIEAFDWLLRNARHEESLLIRLKHLEDEAKRRSDRVDELKAEEHRTKSRIRQAKAGLVDTILNQPAP